jgi:hypothetical protein
MSGEAASYYSQTQRFEQQGPAPQQGYNYNNVAYNNGGGVNNNTNYNYNQNNGETGYQNMQEQKQPAYNPQQASQGFDEAFKVEKPKYNDIWAGLLVSL